MPVGDASPQSALCQHTVSSGRTINNRCSGTLRYLIPYLLSTHKRNGESNRLQHRPSDTTSHGTPDFPLSSDPAGHGIPASRARKYELRLPLQLRAPSRHLHAWPDQLAFLFGIKYWYMYTSPSPSTSSFSAAACLGHRNISAGSSTTGNKE